MFPYIEVSKMFSVVVLSSFLVGVEGTNSSSSRAATKNGWPALSVLCCCCVKRHFDRAKTFFRQPQKSAPLTLEARMNLLLLSHCLLWGVQEARRSPRKKNLFMEVEWWREEKKKSTHEFGFLMNSIWNFRCHEANKDKLRRAAQKRGEVVRVLSSWPVPSSSSRNEM